VQVRFSEATVVLAGSLICVCCNHSVSIVPQICIVGSGPAGFGVAQTLLKVCWNNFGGDDVSTVVLFFQLPVGTIVDALVHPSPYSSEHSKPGTYI